MIQVRRVGRRRMLAVPIAHLADGPSGRARVWRGGKQIQVLDPDGNPIELFEPAG